MKIIAFTIDRHAEVLALWQQTEGVCVREADSREAIGRYLDRNPGLSFLAEVDGRVVGSALSGHDGRRGYVQHVAVDVAYRRRGIAQKLVARCLESLKREGINKAHLEVLTENIDGGAYWERRGWTSREDTRRYSIILTDNPNA